MEASGASWLRVHFGAVKLIGQAKAHQPKGLPEAPQSKTRAHTVTPSTSSWLLPSRFVDNCFLVTPGLKRLPRVLLSARNVYIITCCHCVRAIRGHDGSSGQSSLSRGYFLAESCFVSWRWTRWKARTMKEDILFWSLELSRRCNIKQLTRFILLIAAVSC